MRKTVLKESPYLRSKVQSRRKMSDTYPVIARC